MPERMYGIVREGLTGWEPHTYDEDRATRIFPVWRTRKEAVAYRRDFLTDLRDAGMDPDRLTVVPVEVTPYGFKLPTLDIVWTHDDVQRLS